MSLPAGQVYIPLGRLSFPKLWKPEGIKADPTSKPRYGCQILLPKTDTETKASLDAEVDRLTKEKFKGVKLKSADLFIKDGDVEGDEITAGHWVISANRAESQGRPDIYDRDKKPLIPEDGKPYAGCYCDYVISIFVPGQWKKITAGLEVVRFLEDGERLGAPKVDVGTAMPDMEPEDEDEFEA